MTTKKKIALIGSFSVGKTSLIGRYCFSIFKEKYLTTVGVKIDKKNIVIDDQEITLVIWDIQGESNFSEYRRSALKGASGVVVVADRTRVDTVHAAIDLEMKVRQHYGNKTLFLLNKADLDGSVTPSHFPNPDRVIETSAKTGAGVEQAFERITRDVIA